MNTTIAKAKTSAKRPAARAEGGVRRRKETMTEGFS